MFEMFLWFWKLVTSCQTAVMAQIYSSIINEPKQTTQLSCDKERDVKCCGGLKDTRWRSGCVWLLGLWSLMEKRPRRQVRSKDRQDTREQLQPSGCDRGQTGREDSCPALDQLKDNMETYERTGPRTGHWGDTQHPSASQREQTTSHQVRTCPSFQLSTATMKMKKTVQGNQISPDLK